MNAWIPAALAASLVLIVDPAVADAGTATGPVEIPFRLEGGYIVVDAELPGGRHLPFVFDSGLSNGNIVTTATAKALGLKPDAKAGAKLGVNDASGVRSDAALTRIPSLRIGGAKLVDSSFAIVPVPSQVTARPGKTSLAGFIGAPLLQDSVLCIDYAHETMQRWPRTTFSSGGFTAIPMKQVHALPTVSATIDGRRATLIVDSGNDGAVLVYQDFADRNEFRKRYPRSSTQAGSGGAGQDFEATTVEVDSVMLSPEADFRHVPLTVIPQGMDPAWGIDGMIGYEVLSRLDPCLDRDGQRFLFVAR